MPTITSPKGIATAPHPPPPMTLQRLTPRELTPIVLDDSDVAGEDATADKKQQKIERASAPLVLRVAIRPGRMTTLTVVSIGSIIALVVFLHRGHELARYTKHGLSQTEQSMLLDKYNSYAGNVAAMFGKPIELFVTAAVQVLVLRFLTRSLLRPQPDRRVAVVALVASMGLGYMIGNGFNALNVQFHELPVQPVIVASDLSAESNVTNAEYANRTTSVARSIPETAPRNPTTNTVLRSLVLPREPKPIPKCDWYNTQVEFRAYIPDDVLEFGMPQRDWMKQLLPEALESQQLRVWINATDKHANRDVRAADLPMTARRAANLFLHGLFLSSQYIPWGKNEVWGEEFVNKTALLRDGETERNMSTAMLTGLIPLDPTVEELDQREWFLRKSAPMLSRLFASGTANMSRSDIAMEFSHTQISPSITLDALTFHVDVDPALYTNEIDAKNPNTRYYNLSPTQCSPWPGHCVIEKNDRAPFAGLQSDSLYDAPMQVHAYAVCLDANGSEKMQSRVQASAMSDFNVFDCTKTSNASMLLVSVAKRLRADALLQNRYANSSQLFDGHGAVAVNLTKTYAFTVARLGWVLEDLSKTFGARCESGASGCTGLSVELSGGQQQLVVGSAALPLDLLSRLYIHHDVQQRPMTLVHITEPPRKDHPDYFHLAGDMLYPHNVKTLEWTTVRTDEGTNCSAHVEDRVRLVLNNHMYMETTLQATYTAGIFFLFQDAVARYVLQRGSSTNRTLRFDGNIHDVALWLSIPLENTVLTLSGCVLLSLALFGALLWSLYCRFTKRPDLLVHITTPHVIARAMLDESQFPSLLLHRRVMDTSDGFTQKTVAAFEIQSLLLQHQKNSEHRVAASA